jgi:hypothetical protein
MRLEHIIQEANVAAKIKDPKTMKMLGIAMRHDGTLPKGKVAALGPKPSDEDILKLWSDMLDASLRSTDYGDVSADGKFDEWLTRMYMNGVVDYEDINGEGGDALGAWKALSVRGKLSEKHQDFNKFKNLRQIQAIVNDRAYRDELRKIKDAEVIEKHKKEKKELTIVDDERFLAVVPFNYGSCYTFNNSNGFPASFCTGSSSGLTWFNRYAKDGVIISVIDKENMDNVNGKWQIHAATNQINNGDQTVRSDERFANLFPGLMKKIIAGLESNAAEIKASSTELMRDGYDIATEVAELKRRFPLSYASSDEPEAEQDVDPDETPGTWRVTQTASGRTATIQGNSLADVQQKVITRYPDSTIADYTWERQAQG